MITLMLEWEQALYQKTKILKWGGVCIGNGAIVGACALVNQNVPENATAVGIPCRIMEREGNE